MPWCARTKPQSRFYVPNYYLRFNPLWVVGVIIIFIIITSKEDRGDHLSSKNRNHVKRGDGSTAVFLHFRCIEILARGGGGDVDVGDGRRSPQLPQRAHIIVNRNHHYVAAGFVSGRYATTLARVYTLLTRIPFAAGPPAFRGLGTRF